MIHIIKDDYLHKYTIVLEKDDFKSIYLSLVMGVVDTETIDQLIEAMFYALETKD
jgi:hypothetical protein